MHTLYGCIVLFSSALILHDIYTRIQGLRRNIRIAKSTGLPYVVVPFSFRALPWKVAHRVFGPILRKLPQPNTKGWFQIRQIQRIWHEGYEPFANVGSDTFITVYPTRILLWTCEAEIVEQVCARHNGFEKPLKFMEILNIHGPTVAATAGQESRLYRKTAQPSINPKTHETVWNHMLEQATGLTDLWRSPEGGRGRPSNLPRDIAKLTIHVFSYAAYGKRMDWHEPDDVRQRLRGSGHTLNFGEAIQRSLDQMVTICLTPRFLLKNSPLPIHKKAYEAFVEFRRYLEELRDQKQAEIIRQGPSARPNLLGAFVQASEFPGNPEHDKRDVNSIIGDSAVFGNMYIFLLAGHETTANTLVYALTLMACFPDKQKLLHAELDLVLGSRPSDEWTYDKDFAALNNGYTGAILLEVMRNFGILPAIPKHTLSEPKRIWRTNSSRQIHIPADTVVMINTSALHRNPKYWPTVTASNGSQGEGPPYPASSFKPEYWFGGTDTMTAEQLRGARITTQPKRGAWMAFSEGPRACMGQQFAKAGLCAAMAQIFKYYKVKLNVPRPGSMQDGQKAWEYARSVAMRELSDGTEFFSNLKMSKGVPLKFEKRKL
ncbi:MAG: hypothetical protein M1831_004857 [Alyxoria varia]|nr:MAG: hypothetical protein M1831_004857 [Alyxoria varia]